MLRLAVPAVYGPQPRVWVVDVGREQVGQSLRVGLDLAALERVGFTTRRRAPLSRRCRGIGHNVRMRASDYEFFDAGFLAFAHRGGARYPANVGRENTQDAFQQAVDLGYRYLETDVHATADGRLVAFHDASLDRVTDRSGAIAELSFDEVRAARIDGELQIPTLEELLTAFPQARFNIDAKADATLEPLASVIREYEAADRVCLSSFSARRLHRLRQLLPGVPTGAISRAIAQLRFAPALSRLPALRNLFTFSGVAVQLPTTYRIAGRELTLLTPSLISAAHRAGKQVHVWTIDDETQMDRLIDLGVDGIFTDRIDILKTVATRRGLWTGHDHRHR